MKRVAVGIGVGAVAALAVLGYNYWAYCCGRCTLGGFFRFGLMDGLLLGLLPLALLVLLAVKRWRRRRLARSICPCGAPLADDWSFCPACGASRHPRF